MNYPKETPKKNKHDGTKLTNYSTWNTRRIRIVIRGGLRGLIDISYDECDKHRGEDAGLQGHLGSMWCDSSASYKSLISLSPEQSLTCNSSAPLLVSHPDLHESCTFRVVGLGPVFGVNCIEGGTLSPMGGRRIPSVYTMYFLSPIWLFQTRLYP